ncbi:MAG: hypothetical protein ACOX3Q_02195 [Clostridia bacterium]|jgi:hypothetical protein
MRTKNFYIFCLVVMILLSTTSCSSQTVPVLRVAEFNMPKTHFSVLDLYDTKEYPKPKETEIVEETEEKEIKPRYSPPAGEVIITFEGSFTEEFSNFEFNIMQGGAYIDIRVSGTEWARDVGSDPELTQILIDSIEGPQQWRRLIATRLNIDNIDRLTGNLLRIRIPVPDYFNITSTEHLSFKFPSVLLQGVKQDTIIVREKLYIRNGMGTEEDPFTLLEARDLKALSVYPDMVFRLEKDFDMEGYEWEPFEFRGTLYGNGKTIKNLHIKSDGSNPSGLFSVLSGTVTDLSLSDVTVEGGNETGAIAGINKGVIKGCFVTGTVKGNNNTGGVAGINEGTVEKTNVICSVAGQNNVGGIVGSVLSGLVQGCCSFSSVTGVNSVGGIAGRAAYPGKISSCLITGGFINYTGSLSAVGRICGTPDNNTLFNNAGTPEFEIMPLGSVQRTVVFGASYDNNSLSHRHGENLQCITEPTLSMEAVCDTGRKTYPDTNELFHYDLTYYGLNLLVKLNNGIWLEEEIKTPEGIKMVTDTLKQSFRNVKANAADLSIKPENIQVHKNVLIIQSDPIKQFRTEGDFSLKIQLPLSVIATWSKESHVETIEGIPYLNVMGTKESPYPIRTERELWHFNEDPYSHYKLMNDIVLFESETWYWPEKVFGSLDFNGKRIIRAEDMFKNPYTDEITPIP